MIEDTIARIENRLATANNLSPERRAELTELLGQLRREAATLPRTATRPPPGTGSMQTRGGGSTGDEEMDSAIDRLRESITGYEISHPQLIGTVNRISTILANMGF